MAEAWCDELASVIAEEYDVERPVTCRFLRHGFNEHFRATTADGTELHVRVYLDGKYYIGGDDDFRCELALTAGLAAAGCPVAAPIPRRDGQLLTIADVDDRKRRIALLAVAPGDVNGQPTETEAATIGDAVARIHAATDDLAPTLPGSRYVLDQRYLIEQPLEQLRRAVPEAPELATIESVAKDLAAFLEGLPRETSDFGLIHADFHLGNMHLTDDGRLTIFDFDHGANGWRAYDFAALKLSLPDEHWAAALAAYERVRRLPPGLDDIGMFVKLRSLWDIGDILAMEAVWGNDDATRHVRDQLPKLCERLAGA